jgi:hypothetical protein
MLKDGSDKRHALATSNKRTSQLHVTTAGEPTGATGSCCHGNCSSSLEVVSQERFQQQLEAMSSFADTERRSKPELSQNSSQRASRCSRGKRNMPIIVCLRESIRTHGTRRSSKTSTSFIRRTLSESSASVTDVSVQTLISMSEDLPASAPPTEKKANNFSAFLTAIEKVQSKSQRFIPAIQNVEAFTERKHVARNEPGSATVLNNEDPHISCADALRPIELTHCKNIDVIYNDLRGSKLSYSDELSDQTEPESSSGPSSSSESDTEEQISDNNDVAPQQCPKCLAAFFAYTHYYALGSKYFKIEVVDNDVNDAVDAQDAAYSDIQTQHHSWRPFSGHRHIDVVSLDLTGSDVTFTVEQLSVNSSSTNSNCSSSRSTSATSSTEFSHNFYCTMFGFVPCVPGYCFVPAYYFTFPMWSVSKASSSCLSNIDKQNLNIHSSVGAPQCSCEFHCQLFSLSHPFNCVCCWPITQFSTIILSMLC